MSMSTNLVAILLLCLPVAACADEAIASAQSADQAEDGIEIVLRKGQVLSYVMPLRGAANAAARDEYQKRASPLGRKHGLRNLAGFAIERKLVGDYEPDALMMFSWPGRESVDAFAAEPEWPGIELLRQDAWDGLNIYSAPVEDDVTLQFDKTKVYTLAIAWIAEDRPDDYAAYMKGIEPDLAAVGGRFVYSMFSPGFETLGSSTRAPARATIVEWPSLAALSELRKRPSYQRHYANFESGVDGFEFYQISPMQPQGRGERN